MLILRRSRINVCFSSQRLCGFFHPSLAVTPASGSVYLLRWMCLSTTVAKGGAVIIDSRLRTFGNIYRQPPIHQLPRVTPHPFALPARRMRPRWLLNRRPLLKPMNQRLQPRPYHIVNEPNPTLTRSFSSNMSTEICYIRLLSLRTSRKERYCIST